MTKTVRTARQIKIKIKIKIKIPAVPLMEPWKPANSLQQPTNYQGGKVKVELVQTDDDGNTYSDQSMEVDDPQFPLSIQDLNGHPGITSGTVVLYEWIDDSYQIIDQYDVSFRQVN